MRAQPAVDLIPPAAVHGEGLLEIAAPELSVCRGLAGKQTCATHSRIAFINLLA
jgi:hypothetical protein